MLSKSATKKPIYNTDKSKSEKNDGVKKRTTTTTIVESNTAATVANDEDIDDVQRFPMPEQTPMLITNTNSKLSNIKTSPHMKLTQV